MPQIYYLNPPPNPFWDFVQEIHDHPIFAGPLRRPHRHHGPPSPPPSSGPAPAATSQPAAPQPEISEKARGKQPTVEDPPEVDPTTIKPEPKKNDEKKDEKDIPFRGRGRFAHVFDGEDNEAHRGRGEHPSRRGRGRADWSGPPPFMFGHPFFARPPWAQHGPQDPDTRNRTPQGPPSHHQHGSQPWARGPCAPGGPRHRGSPPHGPRPGFDLGEFLNKLGDRLGVDLSNAAEGLGLTADRFTAGRTGEDINFVPRADIFENKDLYTIHLSLPGAKKSDIGVNYDGEHSVLRVTGVVHRPNVDEQMLSELVVDGRKRETGVFEKAIRLGTKREPASINVADISAKMTDGVLVVKIPKVEKVHHKREVPISADPVTEGQADYDDEYSEKPVLFDAEEQASVAGTETAEAQKMEPIRLTDMKDNEQSTEQKAQQPASIETSEPVSKHEEAKQEEEKAKLDTGDEQLPAYTAEAGNEEDDWEKFSDASGEGEYVKINVD